MKVRKPQIGDVVYRTTHGNREVSFRITDQAVLDNALKMLALPSGDGVVYEIGDSEQ